MSDDSETGPFLVPEQGFDGELLMTSLPHLENLHFWASFRKREKTERLGQGGGDFTNTDPMHFNKAQSRSWLRECSPQADPLENHIGPKR